MNLAFVSDIDQHGLRFSVKVIDFNDATLTLVNCFDSRRALVLVYAIVSLIFLQGRLNAEHVNGAIRTTTRHAVRVLTHANCLYFTTYCALVSSLGLAIQSRK